MLAAAGTPNLPLPSALDRGALSAFGGLAPVVAAVVLLMALLLVWAVYFRKPQGRRERGRLLEGKQGAHVSSKGDSESKSGRRRRRRRERQRPRNSTLAETGGLPALGTGESKFKKP